MDFAEVQNLIYEAGVVGAGGAGFPTHKKLSDQVETIIVNAAECEPLLAVDKFILKHHMKEINQALSALVDALGAKQGVFAAKHKNMHYIHTDAPNIIAKEIPDIYPAGDEVVLVYETLGKIIPQGQIPLSIGVMVINVETLLNVYNALFHKRHVVYKRVCVIGDVPHPVSLKIPIGTRIKDALQIAGVEDLTGKCVINGGPLMGKLVPHPESDTITKRTKGLLVLPEHHEVVRKKQITNRAVTKRAAAACCDCRMCSDMCPRYLLGYEIEVHKVVSALAYGNRAQDALNMAALCCGCGVCEMVACQQDVCPRHAAIAIKEEMGKNGIRPSFSGAPTEPRPEREHRLVKSSTMLARCGLTKYAKEEVEYIGIPAISNHVEILLSQHIGKPAVPCVSKGQQVKIGECVGKVEPGEMGACVHASISGTVTDVLPDRIIIEG